MQSVPNLGFCNVEPGARTALGFLEGRERERGCVGGCGGACWVSCGSGMLVEEQEGSTLRWAVGAGRGAEVVSLHEPLSDVLCDSGYCLSQHLPQP